MSDAQTILRMIEEVSPDETAKLDEIDCRTNALVKGIVFEQMAPDYDFVLGGYWTPDIRGCAKYKRMFPVKYTRSRDALKAIRPEGWLFVCQPRIAQAIGPNIEYSEPEVNYYEHTTLQSPILGLPTEELAELHAIIQAIEYERTHNA